MKNLSNFKAFKLNKVQMNKVNGGVNAKQYCADIHANYMENGDNWNSDTKTGFAMGWTKAGCGAYYKDVCF